MSAPDRASRDEALVGLGDLGKRRHKARICKRAGCGEEFLARRSTKEFCSDGCRTLHNKEEAARIAPLQAMLALIGEEERAAWSGCRCNGGHVLATDEEGHHYCFKCARLIDGRKVYDRIIGELEKGKPPEVIAEALSRDLVPMVYGEPYKGETVWEDKDGDRYRAGWSARAVERVVKDGEYLTPKRIPFVEIPIPSSVPMPKLDEEKPGRKPRRGRNHRTSSVVRVYRGQPEKPEGTVEIRPVSYFAKEKKAK